LCRYQYVDFIVNLLFHCPPPLPFAQPAALARLLSDQSQALLAAHRRIAEWERRSSQASRSWYALLRRAEAGEAKAGEVCVTPSPPLFLKFLLLYKYLMIVPLWWRRFFCLFQWLQFSSAFFFFFFFFFASNRQFTIKNHKLWANAVVAAITAKRIAVNFMVFLAKILRFFNQFSKVRIAKKKKKKRKKKKKKEKWSKKKKEKKKKEKKGRSGRQKSHRNIINKRE
jgi:hypothetical protein